MTTFAVTGHTVSVVPVPAGHAVVVVVALPAGVTVLVVPVPAAHTVSVVPVPVAYLNQDLPLWPDVPVMFRSSAAFRGRSFRSALTDSQTSVYLCFSFQKTTSLFVQYFIYLLKNFEFCNLNML